MPRLADLDGESLRLLESVGSGKASIAAAIEAAGSLVQNGIRTEGMHTIASLRDGDPTRYESKLFRWLAKDLPVEPYWITIDLDDENGVCQPQQVAVCLPHEMVHQAFYADANQFHVSFVGDEGCDGLLRWWSEALSQDWGKAHPALQGATHQRLQQLLPQIWHVDGAEMYRNQEFNVWSSRSPLCIGHWRDIKHMYCFIECAKMRSRQAFTSAHTVVAQVLAWSVHISETGIGPKHGFYGEPLAGRRALMADKPLAGGYAMIFSGWTGD